MIYVVTNLAPRYHQISIDEFYSGVNTGNKITNNFTNTRTIELNELTDKYRKINIGRLINRLEEFNIRTESLRNADKHSLYDMFFIPKKTGGKRKISAPKPELMVALRDLKTIFEFDFRAKYHTSAFAYIKNRSTLDAVKRHQANESRWFGKFDCSDFFGSTTLDFTMHMLSMIYPFSEVVKSEKGENELRKALELGFLDGGLPQGTPLSPTLTNIIMIPIDYKISNSLKNFQQKSFVYTRYADDILVSSKYEFNIADVEAEIIRVFGEFDAPYKLNQKKTRYGSRAGSNWNLGVMLNKDNNITIGHKRKKQFEAILYSFIMDELNGSPWSADETRVLAGQKSYYLMVEPAAITGIINHMNKKYNVNVDRMIKNKI